MTPQERAKAITDSWFSPDKLTAKPVDLRGARDLIAAQIEEAEREAVEKAWGKDDLDHFKRVQMQGVREGFNTAKEQAFEIASDNGTNCCECAEQIRAMKAEEKLNTTTEDKQ